jgi:hypothetical protein
MNFYRLSMYFQWLMSIFWVFWNLCPMPYCGNPDNIVFASIKKPIWRYNNLPVRKIRKFRYDSTGFRKIFQSS